MTKSAPVDSPGDQESLFPVSHSDYFAAFCDTLRVNPELPGWPDAFGDRLREWAIDHLDRSPVTLSLFAGAGGLDIGFHDAGFNIIEMVELEAQFASTLARNSGDNEYLGPGSVQCIDIRAYFPTLDSNIDFIIGGPPCQSFSAAGRRASGVTGINDSRGTLFEEYIRLLKQFKPRGFLFENVYGITGANQGRAWREIQRGFAEAGYKISSRVLDTADFGVPQHRERMFIVGSKEKSFCFPRPTHGPDSAGSGQYHTAGLAVDKCPNDLIPTSVTGRYAGLLEEIPPGLNYSFFTEKMGHPHPLFAWRSKFSDFLYKADPNTPVRTIKAQGGQYTGPFHWDARPFSVQELKRLQTFPDRYHIEGGRQAVVHQIGNSVPPQIARCLAMSILDQFFGTRPPAEISYLGKNETLGFRQRKRELTQVYRRKAKEHLASPASTTLSKVKVESLSRANRMLNPDNFQWAKPTSTVSQPDMPTYACEFDVSSDQWKVAVEEINRNPRFAVSLKVEPAQPNKAWSLPVDAITITASGANSFTLTAAWKYLEEVLAKYHIRADIVQLIGYFQYDPVIKCRWQTAPSRRSKIGKVLRAVTEGIGVRKTLLASDLASDLDIPEDNVGTACQALRRLGFEIRNRNTNPEMPEDHFLIPYPFPTLTPKSVQLRKQLDSQESNHGWRI